MNLINAIFTTFLSLLVAIPLCCCSAKAGHVKESAGCCQTEQENGGSKHDAKDKPETVRLPVDGETETICPDSEPNFAPVLGYTTKISAAWPWIIDDPLRDFFARYSRWII